MQETMICTKCNIEKPLTDFGFRKDTGRYRTQCKVCENEIKRQWAIKNKEKVILSRKKYEANNKELIKARREKYNLKRRNIVYDLTSFQVCTKCNISKPLTDYAYNNKSNYYDKMCKSCKCEYAKEYRKNNKEKIALRDKLYRENNKERLAEKQKQYYEENKDKVSLRSKKWREKNREEILLKKKIYREEHKEEIALQQKEYRENNKETIALQHKEYRENNPQVMKKWRKENKPMINKNRREYYAKRTSSDPIYKLSLQVRNLIYSSFKRKKYVKNKHTYDIIGLEADDFYNYLLQTFKDNYGYDWDGKEEIHIDHIIPLSSAKTEEEVIKLCHYSNLQLLKADDNIEKKAKLDWSLENKEIR